MKVLLIRSPSLTGGTNSRLAASLAKIMGVVPPLGLLYVAAVLERSKIPVNVLDALVEEIDMAETQRRIKDYAPDLVGIAISSSTIKQDLDVARFCKEAGAKVLFGGAHMTSYPHELLSYDEVDFGIMGEGETPFLKLTEALRDSLPYEHIDGLVFKKNGRVTINKPWIEPDLNALPYPARHMVPWEKYSIIIADHPMATISTGRGCPYRCGFCYKQPSDMKYRFRSADSIMGEVHEVYNRYKVREICFVDDTFTVEKKHVLEFCDKFIAAGLHKKIKWQTTTRVDCVDYELLKRMKEAGCRQLRFGIESGDPETLKLMNKQISLERAKQVVKWCREIGIESFSYFQIGYAHETEESIQRTIDFSIDLDLDLVMYNVATPLPQTPLYMLAMQEGIIQGDYWREYTLGKRTDRIPFFVKDADKWVSRAYKAFFFRPTFMLRQVGKLRSPRMFKKYVEAFLAITFFNMVPDEEAKVDESAAAGTTTA
ncbi:MAG: radical SAM protein [Candidatus Diapherotrites archaeon]|uniref:Radical SAM protein n=1 Tax=Candidatus Iainarchaeum sp. TaxID=3101447 RepID=A0A8T4C5J6_9ARCH|nr:radical SAM protein [Candidatus Diapherotrites archaeon]